MPARRQICPAGKEEAGAAALEEEEEAGVVAGNEEEAGAAARPARCLVLALGLPLVRRFRLCARLPRARSPTSALVEVAASAATHPSRTLAPAFAVVEEEAGAPDLPCRALEEEAGVVAGKERGGWRDCSGGGEGWCVAGNEEKPGLLLPALHTSASTFASRASSPARPSKWLRGEREADVSPRWRRWTRGTIASVFHF
ncbi:hypothetical protein PR202_gb21544 [Eleusine coracana subsp. coracana]|uniref:Uncharacterized protein n=1 Tax=Eleusine coracana subsp. coracana TaxID=191504 RepID=A0AAV5FED1_ELECO|nr:hypothetical protein PR202_gb21544 [Eleusine coracana subsp. coracana]